MNKLIFIVFLIFSFTTSSYAAEDAAETDFIPPMIERNDWSVVEEEAVCYSYSEIKDTDTGFSYFTYTLEYSDFFAQISITEERHPANKSKEELMQEKADGVDYYTKYLQYIQGDVSVKNDIINFVSEDGKTKEIFTIVYDKDKKIVKIKNKKTGILWEKGECPKMIISIGG